MDWTSDLPFSRSYLAVVVVVAAVVGGLALFGQSSTLALAAAILGLYVLHLFSNWQLAATQRKQWESVRQVERMLHDIGEARGRAEMGDPEITAVGDARAEPGGEGAEAAVEAASGSDVEAGGEDDDSVLVPRHYKLGTVAVVEETLTPEEVARVLAVQDRQPDRKFGDIAVGLDLVSESELDQLLEVQEQGLYHPEDIGRARRELKEYRRRKAAELGTGP